MTDKRRFPYRQVPHSYCGTNPDRQSVGEPGHCEDCCSVGHIVAHPHLGCGDVGCYQDHVDSEPTHPSPYDLVGRRVVARHASHPRHTHAVGRVVGYLNAPQFLIQTELGERFVWQADLCVPATDEQPDRGPAPEAGFRETHEQYLGLLGALIYRATGRWAPGEDILPQYEKAMAALLPIGETVDD